MGTNFQVANTGNTRIGTGAFDASAALTINSTTQGALFPRMTTAERDAIVSPADGLVVYNTVTMELNYFDGSTWQSIEAGGGGITYPLLADDGTLGAPSYAFLNDSDCGLLRVGANNIAMAINGTRNVVFHAVGTQFWPGGSLVGYFTSLGCGLSSGHFYTDAANPGSAGSPAFEVGGTTSGKGMYEAGSHVLAFSTNNTERMRLDDVGNMGIGGAPISNGILTLTSLSKAFVPPRMTSAQRNAIGSPAAGMMVYNTTDSLMSFYDGVTWQNIEAGSVSFPLLASLGSAAAPSYSFSGDDNTGLYSSGADVLNFSTNSTSRLSISTAAITASLQILTTNGSLGAPAIAPSAGTNTGFQFLNSNNSVDIVSNGVSLATFAKDIIQTFQIRAQSGIGIQGGNNISIAGECIFNNHHYPTVNNSFSSGTASFKWSDVWGVTIHSGDIELDNHWRITEGDKVGHPEEGVMFLSPEGKKFKIAMSEVE